MTKANKEATRKRSSLNSGLDALEVIAALGSPMTMTEISASVGLTKASVHKLLATLEARDYVRRLRDQRYVISIKAWEIGCIAAPFEMTRLATPYMAQLVRQVKDGVTLGILSGAEMLCIQLIESPQAVRVHENIGDRTPVHSLSSGLAFLSAFDDETVLRILPKVLYPLTDRTICDRHRLLEMIAEVRDRGYAVNHGMCKPDASGIAAVVRGPDGGPAATLCIGMPSYRATDERIAEIAPQLLVAARAIEAEYGAPGADLPPNRHE